MFYGFGDVRLMKCSSSVIVREIAGSEGLGNQASVTETLVSSVNPLFLLPRNPVMVLCWRLADPVMSLSAVVGVGKAGLYRVQLTSTSRKQSPRRICKRLTSARISCLGVHGWELR